MFSFYKFKNVEDVCVDVGPFLEECNHAESRFHVDERCKVIVSFNGLCVKGPADVRADLLSN